MRRHYENAARINTTLVRVLVTLNIALLAVLFLHWTPAASVIAQPGAGPTPPQGLVNPADQRREMITELKRLSQKIDTLNERLSRPLEVRVIEMPATSGD